MKTIIFLVSLFLLLAAQHSDLLASDNFSIVVSRETSRNGLIIGNLIVNGIPVGTAYENQSLAIPAKFYKGVLRYWSKKNFVQGPLGAMGNVGDFLLEVSDTDPPSSATRTDILFHGGNKPKQSKGCIMLGPINRDASSSQPSVGPDHPLYKLRVMFYGSESPTSTPDKRITIQVKDP